MTWVLRGLLLLAATVPVFAATAFHPVWWQIFIAAAIGSALGQLAVRFVRGRVRWVVVVVAVAVLGVSVGYTFRRGSRDVATFPTGMLVVKSKSLTWDDVHAIQASATVELAVPYLSSTQQVTSDDQNWNTIVAGTTPDYFTLMDWRLAAGEPLDASKFKVVLLGETVARQLFGRSSAVGQTIRIRGVPFEVIGVLAHRGITEIGQDLDDVVLMSVETYQAKISGSVAHLVRGILFVSPKSRGELDRLEAEVRSLLHDRHLLGPGDDDDDLMIRRL